MWFSYLHYCVSVLVTEPERQRLWRLVAYEKGVGGFESNLAEAMEHMAVSAAVAKRHAEAHCHLALVLEQGRGVAQSSELAAMLYGQATDRGSAGALCSLARRYGDGCGVRQSKEEAFKLCRAAAVEGCAQAQHDVACMYREGTGTAAVRSEAVRWIKAAAAQGHQGAAVAVGGLEVAYAL